MTTGIRGNVAGCIKHYQASLDQRIQQGNWDLVCQDEELCKEMEEVLSKCSAQDFHPQLGLDTLALVEASVKASPNVLCQNKLKCLARAFEVLELAALNLYTCPWRKEYKVVKMYSGMFTHSVKPALSSKQAKKLFGLMGYQSSGPGEEDELRLSSKPVKAHVLLQLACAFFTARIECQLLLSAVATLGGSIQSELQLIQDRKDGHSLHEALDNAFKLLEAKPKSSNNQMTDLDGPLDMYTDGTLASPPSLPYIPPEESAISFNTSYSHTSQVKREKDEKTTCDQISNLILTQQTKIENEKEVPATETVSLKSANMCNCLQSSSSHLTQCAQCEEIHDETCPRFKNCQKQGHNVRLKWQPRATEDQPKSQEKTFKNSLQQHSCMSSPTNDFFLVCYNCYYIHDLQCNDVLKCVNQRHNVQSTGRLQPPQKEKTAKPERHTCLKADNNYYVICGTCNKYHDCLCTEKERCQKSGHDVKYVMEPDELETKSSPGSGSGSDSSTGKLQLPQENKTTTAPERHTCLKGNNKYHAICYTCNKYHDCLCTERERCQKSGHDVKYVMEPDELETKSSPGSGSVSDSSTGKLQLPQENKMTTAPERHTCLKVYDKYYAVCYTCNKYHDCLCTEKKRCQKSGHDVKYLMEPDEQEGQSLLVPLHYHECCSSKQPDFVCLTCRVFHSFNCTNGQCFKHENKYFDSVCTECLCNEFFTLCQYCFKQYCKACWFKNPMHCKCGKPFLSTNV